MKANTSCIYDDNYLEVVKKLNGRVYFVSSYDNEVHNMSDVDHIIYIEDNKQPYVEVGKWTIDDGLRVDDECTLWTIKEVVEFYK